MLIGECSPFDEIFTHQDPDNDQVRLFNATKMFDFASTAGSVELAEIELTPTHIEFIQRNRGIEPPRVTRLKEPFLSRPIIMAEFPDGSHLTVDGHHRCVKKFLLGQKTIMAYVFAVGQWEPFLVTL